MSIFRRWHRRRDDTGRDELACIDVVELVTDYLEDAMAPADRARVEAHLGACPHCTRYLAQLRATIALAGRLTIDDVDALGVTARAELLAVFRNATPD